ncbi:hypothetical protein A1353_19970 [Methylomonas methanica]|uniref:DUF4136 domain-containing protein n=1 Tax=Methylomonas methanica TaxID=421 RepID=A0A177M2Q4_METMH|nr:hypothetical protein [Methylomonas methanica]OAH99996.1 hypothetical protein A1353_19970 [Methylomonas methanica]
MQSNKLIGVSYRLLVLLVTALLAACSTSPRPMQFRTEIDSLVAVSAPQSNMRFVVLPGNAGANEQDLQFIEFKTYIEKVLANRGYSKASSIQDSNLVMFLSYGVGAPEVHQYTYEVPLWNDMGYYYPYRMSRFYNGYYPGFGVGGYSQRTESYTTFRRYLVLEACDKEAYLQQQQRKQLWKTSVQSNGSSNDLRLVFPYMAAAMQAYLGTNTGHMITVDIDETNTLVRSLLGPYQPSTPQLPQQPR